MERQGEVGLSLATSGYAEEERSFEFEIAVPVGTLDQRTVGSAVIDCREEKDSRGRISPGVR